MEFLSFLLLGNVSWFPLEWKWKEGAFLYFLEPLIHPSCFWVICLSALSLSLADSSAFSQFGRSQATITDMTYEV